MDPIQENKPEADSTPEALPTIDATTNEVLPASSAAPEKLKWYKDTQVIICIVIAIALLGGAGAYTAYNKYFNKGPSVAVVNGMEIYKTDYDESVSLIEQQATQSGSDLADAEIQKQIRQQALDILVNNALLLTAARDAKITASKEEIQAKYDELVTQVGGAEELTAKMAEIGLTEEKLRSNISDRILSDKYIESATTMKDVKATEEEVQALYKAISSTGQQIPPLDQIRAQVEQQIIGQKQQQIIQELLEKLKSSGKIEVQITI